MGYIYMIRNKLNDKKYIGKTLDSIEKRWQEHCHDCKKARCEKRPLYNAMNKYGVENFEIIEIEEVDNEIINEREEYWIAYYNTYHGEGYNGTKDGDGKQLYNYKEIAEKYLELGSHLSKTAQYFHCDRKTVKLALQSENVPLILQPNTISEGVKRLDPETGEVLQVYESKIKAIDWVIDNNLSTAKRKYIANAIRRVIQGKAKTAFKYGWSK